jgi:hypothetical protein
MMSALATLKSSPVRLSQEQGMAVTRQFGDFVQEMAERGIPITEFQNTPAREAAAAKRLGLPEHLIAWLAGLKRI